MNTSLHFLPSPPALIILPDLIPAVPERATELEAYGEHAELLDMRARKHQIRRMRYNRNERA